MPGFQPGRGYRRERGPGGRRGDRGRRCLGFSQGVPPPSYPPPSPLPRVSSSHSLPPPPSPLPRVSSSHANPLAVKTDAPCSVIWDILRCWVKLHPISMNKVTPEVSGAVSFSLSVHTRQYSLGPHAAFDACLHTLSVLGGAGGCFAEREGFVIMVVEGGQPEGPLFSLNPH